MNHQNHSKTQAANVLIPLIRTAATIGFAVAPSSLGFVIIAVSEQLIRSIMVGDDPELLVSELQNQFPNDAIEAADEHAGLVAKVVDAIEGENPDQPASTASNPLDHRTHLDQRTHEASIRIREALDNLSPDVTVRCGSLAPLH